MPSAVPRIVVMGRVYPNISIFDDLSSVGGRSIPGELDMMMISYQYHVVGHIGRCVGNRKCTGKGDEGIEVGSVKRCQIIIE